MQVARSAGLHTAWADKHPAYDLLNRPSGNGVEDLYTPEINAAYKDGDYTTHPNYTMVYDTLHVDAAVNWIQGKDHTGAQAFTGMAPNLFGFNFQVSFASGSMLPVHMLSSNAQGFRNSVNTTKHDAYNPKMIAY